VDIEASSLRVHYQYDTIREITNITTIVKLREMKGSEKIDIYMKFYV